MFGAAKMSDYKHIWSIWSHQHVKLVPLRTLADISGLYLMRAAKGAGGAQWGVTCALLGWLKTRRAAAFWTICRGFTARLGDQLGGRCRSGRWAWPAPGAGGRVGWGTAWSFYLPLTEQEIGIEFGCRCWGVRLVWLALLARWNFRYFKL